MLTNHSSQGRGAGGRLPTIVIAVGAPGARSAGGLPPFTGGARTIDVIFTQIPNLPSQPVGFLRAESSPSSGSPAGDEPLGEKDPGRRDDNPQPPRYDPPGLMPGGAADKGGDRAQSSAKQSHSNFHGAILSLTSGLDSPGPED
jgi:hypothetical protein